MYYYPGDFPSKERNVPDQQLEPIEDYSEMQVNEIDYKAELIFNQPTVDEKIKILKYLVEEDLDDLWDITKDCHHNLWFHIRDMVQSGDL